MPSRDLAILALLVRLKNGRRVAFDAALRKCLNKIFGIGRFSVRRESEDCWTVLIDADARFFEIELASAKNTFVVRSMLPDTRCSGERELRDGTILTDIYRALACVGAATPAVPAIRM